MMSRNLDFERAKQKFDKPLSLRLNVNHKAAQTKQMLGNLLKLGTGAKPITAAVVKSGGGDTGRNGCTGVGGSDKKNTTYMTTSMNLDDLKVSDEDVSRGFWHVNRPSV